MTIAEAREKCKSLVVKVPRDVLLVAILVLASSASFGLGLSAGRDTAGQGSTLQIEGLQADTGGGIQPSADMSQSPPGVSTGATGQVVASKNGSKYYLPSCAAANRISEMNRVWFASPAAAAAAGYTPAANCPGL